MAKIGCAHVSLGSLLAHGIKLRHTTMAGFPRLFRQILAIQIATSPFECVRPAPSLETLLSVEIHLARTSIYSQKNSKNCGKRIKIVGFLVNIKIAIRLRISLRNRLRNRLQKIDSKPPIASTTSPLRSLAKCHQKIIGLPKQL